MATMLKEQILDTIVTKLAAINGAGGYETTVPAANIFRPSAPAAPLEIPTTSMPALIVREVDHKPRPHIRGAEECILKVEIICIAESVSAAAHDEALQDLIGDVKKLVYANKRWATGGPGTELARRTWIEGDIAHEPEVNDVHATAAVLVAILYRADVTSLSTVKAV